MTNKRKKAKLEDVWGMIKDEEIDGRFKEVLSLQKIVDTKTGIEYDGLVDTELLKLINQIHEENENLKKTIKWGYII